VYSDERGDIIEFTIDLTEVDTAEVSVGSPAGQSDIGYGAVFNVTDDSDDGQVTVQLNTFDTNNPDPETGTIAVADDDDSVSDRDFTGTGQPLDGATYDINTSVEGEESDVAALSLTQNAPEAFTLFTAPSVNDIEDAESTADINSFKEDGSVTESSRITSGDLVIHQLEVSGLEGAVAAKGGLLSLVASDDADLSIVQTDATTAPNRDAKVLFNSSNNVNELDMNDVNIIEDGDNDTYFINFPVSEGDTTDDSDLVVDAGDEYEVTVTINEASGLVNEDTAVSRTFTVAERSVDLNTNDELDTGEDIIRVAAGDGQVISGGTSAAPGTDVVVRARATGDSPFLLSQTATVDSSRSFSAEFDFSGISEGQSFEVTAEADRGGDDEVNAVVDAAPTASVDISSQSGAGDTVIVDSVSLSDGGFVTIHDSTVGSDPIGSVLGTSAYLEAGDYTDVEVTLDTPIEESQSVIAMPHQDTDGDQTYDFVSSGGEDDAPYVGDGGNAVTAQAEYTVEAAETATPEPETDAPETDAPETDAPETDEPETTTATDGQPGFGVIVALLAFLAAALIAIRRD
jgi:PGF-CTERM protein